MINLEARDKIKKRAIFTCIIFFSWVVIIFLRLIQLQIIDHPRLKAKVIAQNEDIILLNPTRASIYDRQGTLLAQSLPVYSVFYSAFSNEPWDSQWGRIQPLLTHLDIPSTKAEKIKERIKKKKSFIWIKRKISQEEAEQIKNMDLKGIFLKKETKRFYPLGKLAAQVIGKVDIDEKGLMGVEYKYNSFLAGQPGKSIILKDAIGRKYQEEILHYPTPGQNIYLTLDSVIQYLAERELSKTIEEFQAKWGTVIISYPPSGEILAMANFPTGDPNSASVEALRNIQWNAAIQQIISPGSTFKIITYAAALENHSVAETENFDCHQGYIQIEGTSHRVRDHHRFDVLSFPEILIHSSNVGTVQVAYRLGAANLCRMIQQFKFGEKTGIDLPGEEKGIFRPLEKWSKTSLPSLAIGYEIGVTPIQILQAINIVANKGHLIPLRVAKDKQLYEKLSGDKISPQRILSPATASTLLRYLIRVVKEGTGLTARLPGYLIAGKTGTAQKYDPELGTYTSSAHQSLFTGIIFHRSQPTLSMVVVIDEPQGLYYGSQVAAPLFRRIAEQVLRYLEIPPEKQQPSLVITAQQRRVD
ncbi:MAG: hypothetical protein B5M54_00640 [Candidatus Aminicenantes bacterium 4484_214]|nr:MAG: hypothetical protein B5M54_00640 [Candidatus Aminicenantes bacterium 4484_214]